MIELAKYLYTFKVGNVYTFKVENVCKNGRFHKNDLRI